MITDKKWDELVKKMKKIGPVYQIPRRSKDRLTHFCETCVPMLKGKNVLEIGANAGIFGLCMSEVAEGYIGLEPGNKISGKKQSKTDYFKQLCITVAESEKMKALNGTIKEFAGGSDKIEFDALVMCYTLYHVSDKEVKLLQEKILPRCDLVIIQNREQPRKTKHNHYGFWRSKKVAKFFIKAGYTAEIIWGSDRGAKKAFSEIICKRVQWPPETIEKLKKEKRTPAKINKIGPLKKGSAKKKAPKKVARKVKNT